MSRMLISGGNGFLGSHLAEKALMEGMEVVVVDDMSTISDINVPEQVEFIKMKIEDYEPSEPFDYVAHLAARPSPEDYISHPVSTIMSNSEGTKRTLDIARQNKSIFMYTSSSEVYGEASIIPTPETYFGYVNPNGIRSCYDESKRYSEALIMAYNRQYGLDTRIQRPFNVYGPRIRPDGQYGRVIPRFISQALNNEPITIHGDGSQTRSFLYVEDWLNATWNLQTSKGLSGMVFNVGSSEQHTVLELANLIKKLTGSGSPITYQEKRIDDPTRRAADITLIDSKFGWRPGISLEEGLLKTIEWIKAKL